MRCLTAAVALIALSTGVLSTGVLSTRASAQAVTTRIETRPYYGAVVTVEQGVRVWRPLPPHDRIIINPNGATPLNLNLDSGRPSAPATIQQSQALIQKYRFQPYRGLTTHSR